MSSVWYLQKVIRKIEYCLRFTQQLAKFRLFEDMIIIQIDENFMRFDVF